MVKHNTIVWPIFGTNVRVLQVLPILILEIYCQCCIIIFNYRYIFSIPVTIGALRITTYVSKNQLSLRLLTASTPRNYKIILMNIVKINVTFFYKVLRYTLLSHIFS